MEEFEQEVCHCENCTLQDADENGYIGRHRKPEANA